MLSTRYEPQEIERKWYAWWLEKNLFHSEPDNRKPYTVVIPPPNVTGILHMGHMLNNTIQDVLVRRARMRGFNACWVSGTDHASIATEAKVVDKLRKEGIDKRSLSREEFLSHAWEWTHKHGGIILEQLKRLGASCDWQRTAFTMDEVRSESVIHVFVDLYRKGLIYQGVRMVNWDPEAQTALSDEEVLHIEEQAKLYYLRYQIVGADKALIVATTRPETIMGDVAVCVNPNDPRYKDLLGKKVIVPLVNRAVPIISDEHVDPDFGTGILKITPAHALDDYEIGLKYNLEVIDTFTDKGTIREGIGLYEGMERFAVRKQIVKDLLAASLLEKEEDYTHTIGISERTKAVIEPKLSTQWFLKVESLAKRALEAVEQGEIELMPQRFVGVYRHWLENSRDWCISRQLWWGHRIPAWYLPDGRVVIAHNAEEALREAQRLDPTITPTDLRQDEDVLDTWYSSWLWPMSVFDGVLHPENPDFQYYYPTSDLVTAPDIIFFWVARMVMAGYEYTGKRPFERVYFTGTVRDMLHRKMSKSLGNSPDALELIDKFGADGVRCGMLFCSAAGNDLMFEEQLTEQGRNFCNKIWNAFRLVQGWKTDLQEAHNPARAHAIAMFEARMNEVLLRIEEQMLQYRLSEALLELYRLFWDDFSAWLLELVKPRGEQKMDRVSYEAIERIFEQLLQNLHPFMPFITEELWHNLGNAKERCEKSIMQEHLIEPKNPDPALLEEFELLKQIVGGVRALRQSKGLPLRDELPLNYRGEFAMSVEGVALLEMLASVKVNGRVTEVPAKAASFLVGILECFIPLGDKLDNETERAKLAKDIEYYEGLRAVILKKLGNESFVGKAPVAVVEAEKKKLADTEAKLAALREQIA